MLNRLFFEKVVIYVRFISTFTDVTIKSHFSQIEFLFQAHSSKNSPKNVGKNRKTCYFFLETPSFHWITLQKISKTTSKRHLRLKGVSPPPARSSNTKEVQIKTNKNLVYNGKLWPIVMLRKVTWNPSTMAKKHLIQCFIRHSTSLMNRISTKTQDFLTQINQSTGFVSVSSAWQKDETLVLFCFRHRRESKQYHLHGGRQRRQHYRLAHNISGIYHLECPKL